MRKTYIRPALEIVRVRLQLLAASIRVMCDEGPTMMMTNSRESAGEGRSKDNGSFPWDEWTSEE